MVILLLYEEKLAKKRLRSTGPKVNYKLFVVIVISPSFFYFNYLSLLGLEHIYISYFLQQPKKKRLPAASAHFTLLCFSQFQKIIFSRFCTVANYVIAPNYMLFILDFCYLAVGRIFYKRRLRGISVLFYFSGILLIVFCRADLS